MPRFRMGEKVRVVNKNLSCYGVIGEIYQITEIKGETFYAIKVSPEEAKRIYPNYPEDDDYIWQFFRQDDLEKLSETTSK